MSSSLVAFTFNSLSNLSLITMNLSGLTICFIIANQQLVMLDYIRKKGLTHSNDAEVWMLTSQ